MINPTARTESQTPLRALTSVRFFAALCILFFHGVPVVGAAVLTPGWLSATVSLGYAAVSFFFLLSGYILAVSYLSQPRPGMNGRTFLIARLARIYPLYVVTLLLDTPDWFIGHAKSFGGYVHALAPTGWVLLEHLAMLQAWLPWQRGIDRPNWSLSVEAFLYLMFPLLAPRLWRLSARGALLAAAALYLGGLTVLWLTGGAIPALQLSADARMFLPAMHLPTFLAGVAIARWQHEMRWPLAKWGNLQTWALLVVAGVLLAELLHLSAFAEEPQVYRNSGLLAPCFALVLVALSLEGRQPARWLSVRWLEALGHASYALYLLHVPVLHMTQRLHRSPSWPLFAVYLMVCLGLSLMSFRYLELPLRAWILRRAGINRPAR
jgi:peptidoglycan/LPS O-acetylase OafA/YrhL